MLWNWHQFIKQFPHCNILGWNNCIVNSHTKISFRVQSCHSSTESEYPPQGDLFLYPRLDICRLVSVSTVVISNSANRSLLHYYTQGISSNINLIDLLNITTQLSWVLHIRRYVTKQLKNLKITIIK